MLPRHATRARRLGSLLLVGGQVQQRIRLREDLGREAQQQQLRLPNLSVRKHSLARTVGAAKRVVLRERHWVHETHVARGLANRLLHDVRTLSDVHFVRNRLAICAIRRRGGGVRQDDDGVEPNRLAKGVRDLLQQRQIRRVRSRRNVETIEVKHDVGLVLLGKLLRIVHDGGVVTNVRRRRLQTRRIDESKRHAVNLLLNQLHLLRRVLIVRTRRRRTFAQQRVDHRGLTHATLTQKQDGARKIQIRVGALFLGLLGERHGAIKGRIGRIFLRPFPSLELFCEFQTVDHLRHHRISRALFQSRSQAQELDAKQLQLVRPRRIFVARIWLH